MLRKAILLLAILMGLWACNNKSSVPGIQHIDFTRDLNNETELMLSDLATDIEYIQLESSKDSYVQYTMDWSLSENYLLIYDYMQQKIFLFTSDGKFLRQISREGKGPGEFNHPDQVKISKDEKTLYVLNWKRLLKFSIEGEHLGTITFEAGPRGIMEYGDDFLLTFKFPGTNNFEGYSFGLFNKQGEFLKKYLPAHTGLVNTNKDLQMRGPYVFQDTISYFTMMYDTVFGLTSEFEPYPRMIFKTLNKPTPFSQRDPRDIPNSGFWIAAFRESATHVYITGNIERQMHPLVYNRKTKELVYVEKKIPNDLDGGMNFWPGRITGNKVYSLVNANTFTYYRENGYFYEGEVKNPDKKIALNKMVDSIDENDNPILVIVTLKE